MNSNLLIKLSEISSEKSLHPFVNYISQQFANTIANECPKINFKNSQLQKLWDIHADANELMKLNYELVRLSSLHGSVFLGIIPDNENENYPFFTIGIPIEQKKHGLRLVKLHLLINYVKTTAGTNYVLENWDITTKKQNHANRYIFADGVEKELKNKKWSYFSNWWNPLGNIPYSEFIANPFTFPDVYNVPKNLFENFDYNLDILKTDSAINKGMVYLNIFSTPTQKELIANLEDALINPKKVIFQNKAPWNLLDNKAVQPIQGISNADSIIKKLNYYEMLIKKLAFVKTNSTALGVKQINLDEIETMNADANDYLEMKANLLEKNWERFLKKIYVPFLVYTNKISKIDLEKIEVDVEVSGSTKYLQNPENVYVQNQNAVLVNPNDLNNEKNKKVGEK